MELLFLTVVIKLTFSCIFLCYFQRYLLKEQILGLGEFKQLYGSIPFLMRDPNGKGNTTDCKRFLKSL